MGARITSGTPSAHKHIKNLLITPAARCLGGFFLASQRRLLWGKKSGMSGQGTNPQRLWHNRKKKEDRKDDEVHHALQNGGPACTKRQGTDKKSQGKQDFFFGIEAEREGLSE